jgi:dTDP-4-dehydrorhamnose reductase
MKQIENGVKELFVVDDKLGTPTYTGDFANSMFYHVTQKLPYGLYNMVSKGDASRYDVAVNIVELLSLDVKVTKVDSTHFKHSYFAPRPYSEKLLNSKLEQLQCNHMNYWLDSLKIYLKEYNEQ